MIVNWILLDFEQSVGQNEDFEDAALGFSNIFVSFLTFYRQKNYQLIKNSNYEINQTWKWSFFCVLSFFLVLLAASKHRLLIY